MKIVIGTRRIVITGDQKVWKTVLLGCLMSLFSISIFAQGINSSGNRPIVLRNVNVIDMSSEQAQTNMSVVISGDRITHIGKNVKIPLNGEVIDASGKYLIPGLWDMHHHMFNNISRAGTDNKDANFPLLIANGVTGIRDMWSDAEDIKLAKKWNREIADGKLIGPRIFVSSQIVDGVPTFLPNLLGVKNAKEAREAVRALKKYGAGFIKVYWNLTPEAYFAIADESKKLVIDFAGHVPFLVSARDVSNAGQKSIEHLTGMLETCSSKEDELRKKEWTIEVGEELFATYDSKKCFELFKLFAKNQTYNTPTVVLHRGLTFYDDKDFLNNASFKYMPADQMKQWSESQQVDRLHDPSTRKMIFAKTLEMVGEMHRAGVPILAGTDNNNPFVVPGFFLHDELGFFVQAGMTPFQALETATKNPAKYLGLSKTHGTIEKGKIADLVLLDANPLTNISNTKQIYAVVSNGRYLSKETLKKMLAQVERSARSH